MCNAYNPRFLLQRTRWLNDVEDNIIINKQALVIVRDIGMMCQAKTWGALVTFSDSTCLNKQVSQKTMKNFIQFQPGICEDR